ncbi:MAG: exosortase/archaeosortase family protein [Verrucomicrobia bacterium]|nr:exosortase/archaeosortase family protein [Verrucomicrobiota bacterium]
MDNENQTRGAVENFRLDFLDCWARLPNKGLFFGLLAAWLVLFHFLGNSTFGYVDTPSLMGWMYNAYNTGDGQDGHGNLIPFVVVGLFWWKRKELLSPSLNAWWPGLVLMALALGAHIIGYAVQQPRVSIVAFFIGVYGLMGLAWGPGWLRASFFPFVLFAFCVPFGSLGESITFPLRLLVTKISVGFSHGVLGIDVVRDGSQIFDSQRSFQYDVAPACSGIRSLISLLALTTVYGFVSFKAGWKRLLMMIVAVPLAVIGNVVRITGVIVVAEAFGQEAGSWFEQKFGFVTFAVAIACVLLLGHWLRERESEPPLALEEARTV